MMGFDGWVSVSGVLFPTMLGRTCLMVWYAVSGRGEQRLRGRWRMVEQLK